MPDFLHAYSDDRDSGRAIDQCLKQLETLSPKANLGFVYATVEFGSTFFGRAVEALRSETPVKHWVGSTGIGVCGTGIECFQEPCISIVAGTFPEDSFRVFSSGRIDDERAPLDVFEQEQGEWCDRSHPYVGLVHGDPSASELPDLLPKLCQRMRDGYLIGGLTSAGQNRPYNQVFGRASVSKLSGVLLTDAVPVVTRLTQGCSPIGPRHEVTRAERNILIELNGRPALDVFNDDVGDIIARDLNRAAGYIFAGLPLKGSDTGDYLVRNIIGVDPDKKLIAIGELIEAGDQIMFCRRDRDNAEKDMLRMLGELKGALNGAKPKAGLYYSCLARGPNLFGSNSEELKLIDQELGSFPLAGFFGNGEIAHDRLYGYTGVLALFM